MRNHDSKTASIVARYLEAVRRDPTSDHSHILLQGMPGRDLLQARPATRPDDPKDAQGRPLIAFDIEGLEGEGDENNKTRCVLPPYFAILRLLDSVEGVRFKMQTSAEGKRGEPRSYIHIWFAGRHTTIQRVLFGVPANTDLRQRTEADYHIIAPATFRKTSLTVSRDDVLDHVRRYAGEAIADLLVDLFTLADELHGPELTANDQSAISERNGEEGEE